MHGFNNAQLMHARIGLIIIFILFTDGGDDRVRGGHRGGDRHGGDPCAGASRVCFACWRLFLRLFVVVFLLEYLMRD